MFFVMESASFGNRSLVEVMKPRCSQYNIIFMNSTTFKAINYSCAWTNIIMAWPTTVLNLSLIIAFATSRDRSKPCTLLLLSLAVTDFLCGLVNMPLYFLIFRYIAEVKDPCLFVKFCSPAFLLVTLESFFIVTLIAIERYLSIFHPFFHVSRVSLRNASVCIAVSWVVSMLGTSPLLAGVNIDRLNPYIVVFMVTGIMLNLYCYLRILLRARKVRLQIESEAARFGQSSITSTDKRYIFVGMLIILSMALCFTFQAAHGILKTFGYRKESFKYFNCWQWTLVAVNSFINPFITLSFWPNVRGKVWKILTWRVLCEKTNQ